MNPAKKGLTKKLKSPSILKKILLKFVRNKKLYREITSQKYTTTTVKLGTIFEKSRPSSVILKINGGTPPFHQNLKPTRYLTENFGNIYICIHCLIYLNIKKIQGHF